MLHSEDNGLEDLILASREDAFGVAHVGNAQQVVHESSSYRRAARFPVLFICDLLFAQLNKG